MSKPNLSSEKLALLRCSFSPQILVRGKTLFAQANVLHIDCINVDDSAHVRADVMGSSGYSYEVFVEISADDITSHCSCPYTTQCKHGVAAVYKYFSETKTISTSQPSSLDQWLDNLKALPKRNAVYAASAAGSAGEWSIFFLVSKEHGEWRMKAIERYRKRDGSWGRTQDIKLWAFSESKANSRAEASCINILRAINSALRFGEPTFTIEGDLGHVALKLALQSGKALFHGKKTTPLTLGPTRPLNAKWHEHDGINELVLSVDDHEGEIEILPVNPLMYMLDTQIGILESDISSQEYEVLATMPPIKQDELPALSMSLAEQLGTEHIPLPIHVETSRFETPQAKAVLHGVDFGVNGILPALKLSVCYEDFEYPLDERMIKDNTGKSIQHEYREGTAFTIVRSLMLEQGFIDSLRRKVGFMPSKNINTDEEVWVPSEINPVRHILAWQHIRPRLAELFEQDNWLVDIDDSYPITEKNTNISAELSDEDEGWFSMELDIDFDGTKANTADIIAQWLSNKTPETLPIRDASGKWIIADMSPLRAIQSTLVELYSHGSVTSKLTLPPFKAAELSGIDDLSKVNTKRAPNLRALRKQLASFDGLKDVTPPSSLKAELRDYQQKGLNWLSFLHKYRFGGILADDMGLGKTLQSLAFIQKLKSSRKLKDGALVIAPTSLIWNWQNEAEKFTPLLRTLVLHGPERKSAYNNLADVDLIFTTYALAHRDSELLQKQRFDLLILDEAQYIKNKDAKTAKAVRKIPAGMRLCLTGTPLENHLGELWSIMDFALPSLLGNADFFKQSFRTPIENKGDQARNDQLAQRVAPFMLRRQKEQVAKELPAKTLIDQTVELEGDQKKLYEGIRISMEKRVRDLIKTKGVSKSHIEFLDALLKLRQACIAPQLVKLEQAKRVKSSAKLQWLHDTVPELVADGRRILIFSQFTQMLTLIGELLKSQDIGFCKLTGKTRRRQEAIEDFQNDKHPVFLISLKAGGSGLNLTNADTVIHVDPWWNPAAENQATDRAHRIGQKKSVFVYKLIAKGTVEEKIQAMQKNKQNLADALFDTTQKTTMPKDGEELLALFKR